MILFLNPQSYSLGKELYNIGVHGLIKSSYLHMVLYRNPQDFTVEVDLVENPPTAVVMVAGPEETHQFSVVGLRWERQAAETLLTIFPGWERLDH